MGSFTFSYRSVRVLKVNKKFSIKKWLTSILREVFTLKMTFREKKSLKAVKIYSVNSTSGQLFLKFGIFITYFTLNNR